MPDFASPTTEELREQWVDAGRGGLDLGTSRRLIAEVVRLRALIAELDAYAAVVQRVWFQENRSKLVALEKMRVLFSDERGRIGGLSHAPPPSPPDAHRRYP
ncbi:hypothetical protein [Burkholderia cenocepacia]|uniref:hypothetical protein n=1 Tax=Burkholderia cenocepacia TaxID=95486 RepID=UPI0012378036|nr:hypothetical protein [Burkholderia cenocepacia]